MEEENHSGIQALCKQLMQREKEILSKEKLYGSIQEKGREFDNIKMSISAGEERLESLEKSIRTKSEEHRVMTKKYEDLLELKEWRLNQMQKSFEDRAGELERTEEMLGERKIRLEELEKKKRTSEEALRSIESSISRCLGELAVKEKQLALAKKLEERNSETRRKTLEDWAREHEVKERRFEGLIKDLELKEEFLVSRFEELDLIGKNVDESLKKVESKESSFALLRTLVEERFRDLEIEKELGEKVKVLEMERKEFESSRGDLGFEFITNIVDSELDIEKSEPKPYSHSGHKSRGTLDDVVVVDLDCASPPQSHRNICTVDKDPESVEKLIRRGEIVHAVRHICTMNLTHKFSPVQLLEDFLNEAQTHTALVCKGRRSNAEKKKAVERELAAVEAAADCAKEYELGPEFLPEKYSKRVSDLKNRAIDYSKRKNAEPPQHEKKTKIPRTSPKMPTEVKSPPVFSPVVLQKKPLTTTTTTTSSASPKTWNKPPRGVVKLNFGFAVKDQTGFASVVARNHEGSVMGIWYRKVAGPDPVRGNAAAAVGALRLASAKGWGKVYLEGDSGEVIGNVSGSCKLESAALLKSFRSVTMYCVAPEANRFARDVCVWAAGSNNVDDVSWTPMPSTLAAIFNSKTTYY